MKGLLASAFILTVGLTPMAKAQVPSTSVELGASSKELVDKVQTARQEIEAADLEKRRVLGTIYVIQQRMKKITVEKNSLTDQLFHIQDNVQNIAKLIVSLEAEIIIERGQLKKRLAALYKLSGEGSVAILFSQENPLDVDETLRNLKIVTEKDYLLIRTYQKNVALYKDQRRKLKGQVEQLVTIEKKIKKQESLLAAEHQQKYQIVSNLDRDRTARIKKIRNLRDTSRTSVGESAAGQAQWAELLKPSIFEQKGTLPPPVVGSIVKDFGLTTVEKFKLHLSHKGWEYAAAKGSPISVIFDGTVVFADWINGYGQTLIVDHGDHYYSVYAHIARLKVKTGDTLKKGQTIAEAGSASRRYGEGLYFEIRHFSEPENPAQWVGKPGLKMISKEKGPKDVAQAALNSAALVEEPQ